MEQKPNTGSNPRQMNPVHNVPPEFLKKNYYDNPKFPSSGVKIIDPPEDGTNWLRRNVRNKLSLLAA